jgi:hypothetical protein
MSLLVLGAAILSGCSRLVDEDVSDCGEDLSLDYELQLVTNMRTEIKTVLDLQADLQVATVLENHLEEIFTDFAHDVDLSFYDTDGDMARLEHLGVVMDASQSSYSLFIPARPYIHTCVANLEADPYITLEDADQCRSARLVQHPAVKDTVDAHLSGIFTARERMDIISGIDQRFDVNLYMVNAATALVLDMTDAPDIKDLKVYLRGMADGFMLADSTYTFNSDLVVRTNRLSEEPGGTERCYASTHFPSRDVNPDTKVVIDIEDPDGDIRSDEVLWSWEVYATLQDGSVTKSVIGVYTPLHAAQLKTVKGKVHANGSTSSQDQTVAVSVMLDWQPGQEHDIIL